MEEISLENRHKADICCESGAAIIVLNAVGTAMRDILFYTMVVLTPSMIFVALLLWRNRSHEDDSRGREPDR